MAGSAWWWKEKNGCVEKKERMRGWWLSSSSVESDGGHVMGFKLAACPPSPCDRCRRLPLNVARSTGARVPIPKGEARRWRGGKERWRREADEGDEDERRTSWMKEISNTR